MFQLESSDIQNILIALVVICAIVYGYIEFRKINMKLELLESKLSKMIQPMEMRPMETGPMETGPMETGPMETGPPSEEPLNEPSEELHEDYSQEDTNVNFSEPLINKIINQVEVDIKQDPIIQPNDPDSNKFSVKEDVEEDVEDVEDVEEDVKEDVEDVEDVKGDVKEDVKENVEEDVKEEKSGIFLSVMTNSTNLNNTIDIKTDERIMDLDESPMSSYIPGGNNDPIPEETNYEEYSIKELKNTLEEMNLSTSGNKQKLIERIVSNKNKM